MTPFPPIEQLLPHEPPMVLLDRIVASSSDGTTATFRIRRGTRFVEDDGLETACLMEHMAQTIAADLGYDAYRDGRGVRRGMIVGCREFLVHVDRLAIGDEVEIVATRESAAEAMSRFRCRASRDGACVAEATMTLFHGDMPDMPDRPRG